MDESDWAATGWLLHEKGGRSAAVGRASKRHRGITEGKPTDQKAGNGVGEMRAVTRCIRTRECRQEELLG